MGFFENVTIVNSKLRYVSEITLKIITQPPMRIAVVFSIFMLLAGFWACTHEPLDPNSPVVPPTSSSNCSADSVYFTNEVMPIIASNCTMSGCHDAITQAEDVNLTNYTQIMKYVKAGNASGSKLYKVMIDSDPNDRMPPLPASSLSTTQLAKIQKWINQGAKNNACTGGCDTTAFTYTAVIKPMMETKCVGCHKPGNLGGNIDLSTYAATKVVALNGKLSGSISQQPGYSPMPQNGAKLRDCEITQVSKWINAGSLNN